MKKKPRILITNDDGINAPGIRNLWEALAPFADLTIIAPANEQSGVGLGLTLRTPLHIESVAWDKGTPAWKITGTPADCVRMAISVILKEKPDLIVSGINRGSNAGRNVLYSGTVGGVIEGTMRNIPGVAFSCTNYQQPNYAATQKHIVSLVNYLLEHPLQRGTFLNVNFPENEHEMRGIKLARQGLQYWIENPDLRHHPEGMAYYWLGGKSIICDEHAESDIALLSQGYAAAVPIHVNEMTCQETYATHQSRFETHFTPS
jgi:5'-nucleotidase